MSSGMETQVGLQAIPAKMSAPTRNANTTQFQITINFAPIQSPDSAILGYHAMWKKASESTWIDLNEVTEIYSGVNKLVAYNNVAIGQLYHFKIRARNVYGFGPFSD